MPESTESLNEILSGFSADELFKRGEEITYDDVNILDTSFSEITKKDVSLRTELGKGVALNLPLIASPMDSVVGYKMAIAIAQLGGIAVIHYNHKDERGELSIDGQIEDIRRVKKSQNGFIEDVVTVAPDMTIAGAIEIGERNRIDDEPLKTFPVTENGKSNGRLVGLLESDAYFRGSNTDVPVRDRMISIDRGLITGRVGISIQEAKESLWKNRIKSLPVTDKNGNLAYLVTKRDIEKKTQFPNATLDEKDRLRVLFAVSTWPESYERLERGFEMGADGVVVDTSQGHTRFAHEMLKYIGSKHPDKLLIGGNVSTAEAVAKMAELGVVDAYRCGQGSGSICTTADAIGMARAGATAVYECSRAAKKSRSNMVTIADGGIRDPGVMFKAFCFGAGAVMLGSMLAGTEEAPGELIYTVGGKAVKEYWGMGSRRAKIGGDMRIRDYGGHEEGIVRKVPFKGKVQDYLKEPLDALLHSFEVANCRNISELHGKMREERLRFGRRTAASLSEAKPSN